jgi:hypothetical protein
MDTDRKTQWHTRKWYKEHFGVDPTKLDIQPTEAENPHYRSAAPMLLWKEEDVSLFRSEDGIEKYAKRKAAGQKAYETAKKKREAAREQEKRQLTEWWKQVRTEKPRVQEILKRLWEIGEDIRNWHDLKTECRNERRHNDCDEDDCSDHYSCKNCEAMNQEQDKLREERERLFEELQEICQASKSTIQLARKFHREEQQRAAQEKAREVRMC